MKKVLKIIGLTLIIILCLLIAIPFAFQSQIKDMVKRFINQSLNAKVEFADVSLSLLRSFPQAHVKVDDLVITNFKPFEGDTLAKTKSIAFTLSVKELFKKASDAPIVVNSIQINEASLTLSTDELGNNNYDIVKKPDSSTSKGSENFSFDIEDYKISNSTLAYIDQKSKTEIYVSELNHSGKGSFSAETSELVTQTEANVSLIVDSTKYLNNNKIKLDALIGLDLDKNTYTFKENKGYINQLPLEFEGYVQQLENGQEVDITFENPESSFKDFLAVIPEVYSKNIADVKTSGDFKVKGVIKGLISETTIPTLDISITSDNASFKYPDLPKTVENISINTVVKNTTGNADDTYIDVKTFNFKIDNDVFKSSATLKNITENMLVNADIDGVINLANISKAYPIDIEKELKGILIAKLNTNFDMNAIENSAYERIKNSGYMSVSDFVYSSKEMQNPVYIKSANMKFTPATVTLNNFEAKTGQSDIKATGIIKNLYGFMFSDKDLQGNFNLNSNTFVLNDFISQDKSAEKNSNKAKSLKIPEFLDCTISASANSVVYDNLNLKGVSGSLYIKDQEATLQNLTSNLLDGILAVTGKVSTKTDVPTFNLNLGADSFDISKSFANLDLIKALAPIANVLQGKMNSTINLSGTLNEEFTPNLNSINGKAFVELLTTSINTDQAKVLNSLGEALNFINVKDINLKDLKTQLDFSNGMVNVKPFNLSYKDIDVVISGSHGFDKSLNYNATFNVPAKYLGNEVNSLISKINDDNVKKISIPVTANITGSFTNPKITTDLSSGVSKLTKQLIEIEKQKLLNSGKDKIKELLGGISGIDSKSKNDTSKKDSTTVKTDSVKVDTTTKKTENQVEESIKNALGGLIKNRKKKDSTK
ncbi:AsmA-like C-terminal region-containing protein [Yeosuana sp. MJ-SS3]|uniref:AsmA-like C-terminal region-containing protein n=1 Tax=Gilvirhabdus luticola TaxID=3079858 RepID=A0ABU3U664_9FLAO|nr:AsmA-like C-terminal region-containing protein [Yeosuana sp. MJ-SS3]MDU8885894.1 AsmA-like C-terminal region-containing protein [Yeosuana sp. MJ-SS3]